MNELVKKSIQRAFLFYVYAFLGGCLFYLIERKPENNREAYWRLSQELQHDFRIQFNISINESDFNRFMQRAFEAISAGNKLDWSIINGLIFTMTSLTTIDGKKIQGLRFKHCINWSVTPTLASIFILLKILKFVFIKRTMREVIHICYGHITPETPLGQILTVVYCLVGLPIAMLALKTLGEIVSKMVYKLVFIVETKVLCKKTPRKVTIKSFLITCTLMLLTLCAGGVTQIYVEDGTFIEGVYMWFATISTIGYGDYIPNWSLLKNTEDSETTLWLLISALSLPSLALLSVASGVLNSLVEAIEEFKIQFKSCYKCPRCQKRRCTQLKEPQNAKSANGGPTLDESKEDLTVHKERLRSATF